jgi:hypothetical protein
MIKAYASSDSSPTKGSTKPISWKLDNLRIMIPFFSGLFRTTWFGATCTSYAVVNRTTASREKYQLMDKTALSWRKFRLWINNLDTPTRCSSNDLSVSKISSTCFGQFFAHLQERKTEIYSMWS